MTMLAALAFLRPAGAVIAGIAGWVLGDWHRVVALLAVLAVLTAYVVGDARGRAAEAAKTAQKINDITTIFTKAAADATAREVKRQAEIGAQVTKAYQQQLAARDRADAVKDAATEKEIANYAKELAAVGRSCGLDANDLRLLDPQSPTAAGRR